MTTLATHDLEPDQLDELALIADQHTPLRKPFADAFRDACQAEVNIPGFFDTPLSGEVHPAGPVGWVNPNRVRLALMDRDDYRPQQLSALWSVGYLRKDKTRPLQITGEGSKGNTNKSTFWRRWVGDS